MDSIVDPAVQHLEAREWKLRQDLGTIENSEALIEKLRSATGLSAITIRVCLQRGLQDAESIQTFLSPKLETLTDPLLIKDMDVALERLSRARRDGEKVRIYGDYDVDGTAGAALLSWFLRDSGFQYDALQPDRFKDGYGVGVAAVEDAHRDGVKIILTVDCGITSFDAVDRARSLGIDVIVVDHHQLDPVRGMPAALAVLNPQRSDCPSQLKQLCGCGVAFYLCRALRSRGREERWWPEGQEPNLKQHLDLVVMATAADMVPLTGDNHVLVRHGLEILKVTKKPGVRALLEAAGVGSRELSPGHLGFVIGPRINASGRMGSASRALELLTTLDSSRAALLANELESVNKERGEVQNRIWDEVRVRVEQGLKEGKFKHGIVVADSAWHEGVVGIVASRVTETFRKPAAVIGLREDFGKGSVRSYGGKDVLAALRASSEFLMGFGGHKYAAGLSVAIDRVDQFAEAFDRALGEIAEDKAGQPLLIEGTCAIDDLDVQTLRELERLGPFGPGNPEPVFAVRAHAKTRQILKGRHLKLHLAPAPANHSLAARAAVPVIEAIWFHAAEREALLGDGVLDVEAEWAGVPELNRFRGRTTPTLRVRDWRKLPTV